MVVKPKETPQLLLSIGKGNKELCIETFRSEPSVERLAVRILKRLSGFDRVVNNMVFHAPLLKVRADKLWSIVAANPLRIGSTSTCHFIKRTGDVPCWKGESRFSEKTFR
jgi:hypothetical protein